MSEKSTDSVIKHSSQLDPLWGPWAINAERDRRRQHQTIHGPRRHTWIERNSYFYGCVKRLLSELVEPGKRVLNVRCQTGWFLNAINPSRGLGVEISPSMLAVAQSLYPQFDYLLCDAEALTLDEKFDYILFNNIEDTVELSPAFKALQAACTRHTRLLIYTYNERLSPILKLGEKLGLKWPTLEPNWLSDHDLAAVLHLGGFEWLRSYRIILIPWRIPYVSTFLNRFIARLPLINKLCLIKVVLARPVPHDVDPESLSVSVVIPCKNERDNIAAAVTRVPHMGRHTEIIFCDDASTDGTPDEVRRMQARYPTRDIQLVAGPGVCKADNVWTGFRAATGDVLMILDGDLTVMPEELPLFLQAIAENKGELINGCRLVYPMAKGAMNLANLIGNKAFSLGFSLLLGQRIKDTLCGTKVLWKADWLRIESLVGTWGQKDYWGDYELIFGATKRHLRILDLPVHYQQRIHGTSKMSRVLCNGWNMLHLYALAVLRLRFGY
jgi:SAM-dependent methyltransferase